MRSPRESERVSWEWTLSNNYMYEMSRGEELHKEVVKEVGRKTNIVVPRKPRGEGILERTGWSQLSSFTKKFHIDLLKAVWVKWNKHKSH